MPDARSRTSRRTILLAGGVAGIAAGTAPLALPYGVIAETEGELLGLLLVFEQVQIELYRGILQRYDAAAFAAAGFADPAAAQLAELLAAEEAHAAALTEFASPVTPVSVRFSDASFLPELLHAAAELEHVAVAAYAGAILRPSRRRLAAELIAIHSVEARQAAWIAALLGDDPFPEAFDAALSAGEARAWLESIGADSSSPATPQPAPDAAEQDVVDGIARVLGVTPAEITVVSLIPREWPDSSLGCPQRGEVYLEVITPGFLAQVTVAGEPYEFHADQRGNVVRCP